MHEYRQQCYSHEATIKRLNDELRDTETELNMTRAMQPSEDPADKALIAELEARLESQANDFANQTKELHEKIERFEK